MHLALGIAKRDAERFQRIDPRLQFVVHLELRRLRVRVGAIAVVAKVVHQLDKGFVGLAAEFEPGLRQIHHVELGQFRQLLSSRERQRGQRDMLAIEFLLLGLKLLCRRDRERLVQCVHVFELERAGECAPGVQTGYLPLLDPLEGAHIEARNLGQLLLRPLAHLPE